MIARKLKPCAGCGQDAYLFGHGLCRPCYDKKRSKPMSRQSSKRSSVLDKDRAIYVHLWKIRKHECEECYKPLGDEMRTFYFSHILSKGAHPEHRHNLRNFNILCWDHHQQWEFKDRKSMRIYDRNHLIAEELGGMI